MRTHTRLAADRGGRVIRKARHACKLHPRVVQLSLHVVQAAVAARGATVSARGAAQFARGVTQGNCQTEHIFGLRTTQPDSFVP
jgi:hypothetical protein